MLILACIGLLLLLFTLYAWLIAPQLPRRNMEQLLNFDYALRGLWNAERPENSLSAFQAAVDAGFGMELDVHLTKDGHLVVHHDASLLRMCGEDILIEATTLEQLRTYRLLGTEETIPTLDEVLTVVAGRTPLIVELKVEGNTAALSAAVYERMRRYHGPWCMESFHPTAPRWFKIHAPEVIRGQLTFDHRGDPDRNLPTRVRDLLIAAMPFNVLSRPDFIALEASSERPRSLPMVLLRRMRPLFVCWTIRSQAEMDQCRKRYDLQIFDSFMPEKQA